MKILPALLMASLAWAADTPTQRQLLTNARGMKTDERIALFDKAVKEDSSDLQLKTALASAFIQKLRETGDGGYLIRASGLVASVLETDPGFMQAKRLRCEVEMNLHHFQKVADYAEGMLAGDPSDSEMLGLLGDAQMELGQYDRAGKTYERMTSIGGNLFSYNRLAYYQFVTGHADTALAWMAQAIAAGGRSPENEAWCDSEMGDMLFKLGQLVNAEYAYKAALDKFPGYHRAHAGLAKVLAGRGDWKGAITHAKAAQAVVPLPEYAGLLELFYEKSGDKAKAAEQRDVMDVVERLMAANGEKANRTLALIYADAGRKLPRALELAKAEFEARDDVYSYDALSWVLFKNGKLAEARRASQKALALGTPEPAFYFHAGTIELADGDPEQGRSHLEKAFALNPVFDARNAPLAALALKQFSARQ